MLEKVFRIYFGHSVSEEVSGLSSDSGNTGKDDLPEVFFKTGFRGKTLLYEMRKAGSGRTGLL